MGGGKTPPTTQARLFDFFRLAALAANARRSSPDISGSKLRMTPARPTTLGSDRVTPMPNWRALFAFDDRDIGVTNGVFDLLAHPVVSPRWSTSAPIGTPAIRA